ncbi:hypothetical protein Tco_0205258 [Tanacetum coccineum]
MSKTQDLLGKTQDLLRFGHHNVEIYFDKGSSVGKTQAAKRNVEAKRKQQNSTLKQNAMGVNESSFCRETRGLLLLKYDDDDAMMTSFDGTVVFTTFNKFNRVPGRMVVLRLLLQTLSRIICIQVCIMTVKSNTEFESVVGYHKKKNYVSRANKQLERLSSEGVGNNEQQSDCSSYVKIDCVHSTTKARAAESLEKECNEQRHLSGKVLSYSELNNSVVTGE